MCDRLCLTRSFDSLARLLGIEDTVKLSLRYNIAPGQDIPIARTKAEGGRELALVRWGMSRRRARGPAHGPCLAAVRAEMFKRRPLFRDTLRYRRCLVVANGFYVWQTKNRMRLPWRITLDSGSPFGVAGIWEVRTSPVGRVTESAVIITVAANDVVLPIHPQMPLILDPKNYDAWLRGDMGLDRVRTSLLPFQNGLLRAARVGRIVNDAKNDTIECIAEVAA